MHGAPTPSPCPAHCAALFPSCAFVRAPVWPVCARERRAFFVFLLIICSATTPTWPPAAAARSLWCRARRASAFFPAAGVHNRKAQTLSQRVRRGDGGAGACAHTAGGRPRHASPSWLALDLRSFGGGGNINVPAIPRHSEVRIGCRRLLEQRKLAQSAHVSTLQLWLHRAHPPPPLGSHVSKGCRIDTSAMRGPSLAVASLWAREAGVLCVAR